MPAPRKLDGLLRRVLRALVAVALAGALPPLGAARADPPGSMLHEFVAADPSEDVGFSATTLEGDLPAAIQTPSGLATAPDPRKSPGADHVYGGATTDDSPDATYEPDRDTRRPHVENYDDPFSPATAPFKRLRAYDWVDADYSLRVRDRDKSMTSVRAGGALAAGEEPFYGDMSVDLVAGQPVRIPTVGPGARILRMHTTPDASVDVLHDGADNWFVRGAERSRVRLVLELAIPRDTFGATFADVEWSALDALEATRAASAAHLHDAAVAEVAQAIGVSRALRPRDVVRKMVDYFRGFQPSSVPPSGRQDIYLDLALSRKGVCRHRAFGFLVTALGVGVPARMVVNEAHAWVEVFDGRLWHRVDLGGAAANLDSDPDPSRPPYVSPPDPYAWPSTRDSGQDLADRNRSQAQSKAVPGNGKAADDPGASGASGATGQTNEPEPSKLPASEVTVTAIDGDVHRGLPLHLQGLVKGAGGPCAHLRVDVVLVSHVEVARAERGSSGRAPLAGATVGSLSTDEKGRYDGAVVIPRDFALGDYDLAVQTAGDARCGAGRTK